MKLAYAKPDPANISLVARPPRACILVGDYDELHWSAAFAGAIAAASRVWGAGASLFMPLEDDPADNELFWALASLFDPDCYVQYQPCREDLEYLAPSAYARHLAEVQEEVDAVGLAPEESQAVVEQEMKLALNGSAPLSESLQRLLVARTAPLHRNAELPSHGPLTSNGAGLYPLSDALKLGSLPHTVFEPHASDNPVEGLLLAAQFGALSPALRRHLTEAGVRVERREAPHRIELLRWIYGIGGPGWPMTPFGLGMQGLSWFTANPPDEQVLSIVVGEQPWDFALAYALRRARALAWWLPESYLPDDGERSAALTSLLSPALSGGLPLVVTTASDEQGADRIAGELRARPGQTTVDIRRVTWREALPLRSNRLLVGDRIGFPQPFHLQQGQTTPLNTPVPSFGEGAQETEARWMTEAAIGSGWVQARHSAVGKLLVPNLGTDTVRATADGFAYLGPRSFVQAGVPLQLQTGRPVADPLALQEQISKLAAKAGWSCRLSEKGQFAISAINLLGGFDELCAALKRSELSGVLMSYLDGSAEVPGLRLADRRRYLSREDIDELSQPATSGEVLAELLQAGVLSAGMVLKCTRCRYAAWYRPRDVDPTFTCGRCGAEHRVEQSTQLDHPEPVWRYRQEETLFQFLRHRGELPALAAAARFKDSALPVGLVPEIELTDATGVQREIDFVVSEGGELWLGEGFTAGTYGSASGEMKRLRQLADAATLFNARGVILATSAPALSERTRQRAMTAMPGPWPVWEELTDCELLAHPKRPIDGDGLT